MSERERREGGVSSSRAGWQNPIGGKADNRLCFSILFKLKFDPGGRRGAAVMTAAAAMEAVAASLFQPGGSVPLIRFRCRGRKRDLFDLLTRTRESDTAKHFA